MDSKLRRAALLSSLAAILIVAIAVLAVNRDSSGSAGRTNASAATGTAAAETGTDGVQTESAADGQIGRDLSAFMDDASFFDEEANPVLEAAAALANHLSLIVTSVEKDLRIQVVDGDGALVTGESFLVELENAEKSAESESRDGASGEYKDLDQDGIIYIGDLPSGEYYVSLQPMEGYSVPSNQTRIKVKDKVEYVAIDDISLLIKTEDEIDAEAEDSGVQDALEDADKTEIRSLQTASGQSKSGIDVSKWNGTIDWDKVKNAGVQFAIIRAGYRGSVTGSLVQDICFDANMKGAAAADVPVGVYFFTQATNEVEAVEEASAVLEWIRTYEVVYPIFIDTEGAGGNGRADSLDAETRTLVCEAFCRTIENAGYKAGVYASRNWLNNNLQTDRLENYYTWLAEYRSVPLYQGYYHVWQYTSRGSVDGIEGNVDLDILYE